MAQPRWSVGANTTTLDYRFETTALPVQTMRLKIETNTREHFALLGYERRPYRVENPWFTGGAEVHSFKTEELLGTKLRALYQRSKGRDLFDLDLALRTLDVDDGRGVECFVGYLARSGLSVTRADFKANLAAKLEEPSFGTMFGRSSRTPRSTIRRQRQSLSGRGFSRGCPVCRADHPGAEGSGGFPVVLAG